MMTVEQKQKLFYDEYAMFGWTIADTYKFLCLVGSLYIASKKKDPNMTVYALLCKLEPDFKQYGKLFEITQYHIMAHMYSTQEKFSTFGLKNAKDVVAEIKQLLHVWLPF